MKTVIVSVVAAGGLTALALLVFSQGANVAIYEIVVALVAIVALVALRQRTPERVTAPDRTGRKDRNPIPPELARLERVVRFGRTTELDADRRMLRLLRTVAGELLRARYGIDPDVEPEAAAALLGSDVWEWLRPDRPVDRMKPGLALEEVERLVAALERLGDGAS